MDWDQAVCGVYMYVHFADIAPFPNSADIPATLSMVMYDNVHNWGLMPSFTLTVGGGVINLYSIDTYSENDPLVPPPTN